ncbi:glycosyltransferase [Luteimonas sp. SJ-92]|uniref:Glycosyltransferase n=1 Tax=Luteimonas salinisoli TaxID=2752307 RepID=A0A853JGM9_9GAMM|nr:glycosyltransferase [Luteimonas salinisoli]NZA27872.1 glycosyltransferase [Luteimonas salinisoli]
MKLRILHVTTITEWRGGDAQMYQLYGLLEPDPDFEQWILCPADSVLAGKCRDDAARCVTYAKTRLKLLNAVRAIVSTCRRERVDVIHAHDSSALNACLLAMRLLPRCVKLVLSRKRNNPIGGNPLSRRKYANRRIARIVCVSDAVAGVFDGVVDPSRLLTIHDAVDVDAIAALGRHGRAHREFGLAPGTRLVGNLAGHTAQKDLPTFLRTAAEILRLKPGSMPVRFLLVGDGPQRAQLEALAAELGIADAVVFTGHRRDGLELLAELDVLLISSVTEGLPLTVYEAFAAGVPVVATDAGGIREVVHSGRTGFVVPTGDSAGLARHVLEILADDTLAERLRAEAFALVRAGHTPPVFRDRYRAFYRGLAGP